MVSLGRGRLFKRRDGKYMIYIPVDLAEDSMFPFQEYKKTKRGTDAIPVNVSFKAQPKQIVIEEWKGLK